MDTETQPIATPQSIDDLEPKMRLKGTVKDTQLYGAVVDVGIEYDGMIHISQLASRRVNRVTDVVETGDDVTVWVTSVNPERGRIGLSLVEPPDRAWKEIREGKIYTGVVTRLEDYGAFVDIGAERPGLLHVREMDAGYVKHPSDIVQMNEEIEVKVQKVDRQRRRIDLTLKGTAEAFLVPSDDQPAESQMTAMEAALRRAQSEKKSKKRHVKKTSPDLSEREEILTQTLRKHSGSSSTA